MYEKTARVHLFPNSRNLLENEGVLEMLLGQGPHKLEKLKARTKTKARKIPFAIKRKLETGKCYC